MIPPTPSLIRLKWILLATVVSSIFHYVDNIMFFANYPEPVWIQPRMIDLFWFAMTPLAPLGYQQVKRGHCHISAFLLITYGLCNMLTLGHYNFAPLSHISTKIHLLILFEALMGGILIGYILVLYKQFMQQRN
ncbi:hypothetical protein [Photobacterium sp. R1]